MRRTERDPLTPIDPFDLLRGLSGVAADPAALRTPRAPARENDSPAPPDPHAERRALLGLVRSLVQDPAPDRRVDAVVEALRLAHLRAQDPEGEARESALYDAARRHFHRNETQLRGQARITERIVDRIQSDRPGRHREPSPFQQELRLRGPAGGLAAGRFVLANDRERPAEVAFRVGRLRGVTLPWVDDAALRIEPTHPGLAPGAQRVVRVEVDLVACPARAGDQLELCIDVLDADDVLVKLWVEIRVDEPVGEPA